MNIEQEKKHNEFQLEFQKNSNIKTPEDLNKEKSLLLCARDGNLAFMEYLVENGADIHHNNEEAFHLACYYGQIKIIDYFIKKGVSKDLKNHRAIKWAIEGLQFETTKYLIVEHNFDISIAQKEATLFEYDSLDLDNFIDWCSSYIDSKELKSTLENDLTQNNLIIKQRKI